MSKVNARRHPKVSENRYDYGSIQYMAPKVLKNKFEKIKVYFFEVDIYIFYLQWCILRFF